MPKGGVPQSWQHSLQHCSTPASGNATGPPIGRKEGRRQFSRMVPPLDKENYRPVTRNKKDELLDKENYRPFSLAPTTSKRLRRLFISRIYSYVPVCIRVLLVCPCGVNTKGGRGGAERDEMSAPSA